MMAFAIDAMLMFMVLIAAGAAAENVGIGSSAIIAFALAALVAYHSAGLAHRDVGLGRVVMGIVVVSLKSGPQLSGFQCIARPVVRLAWYASGSVPAGAFHQPILFFLPMLADVALLTFHPMRQTIADMICRTVVVNSPPLQPHRAPAGPMYSANDVEFGPKPRGSRR